jgi:hypothetical protein
LTAADLLEEVKNLRRDERYEEALQCAEAAEEPKNADC